MCLYLRISPPGFQFKKLLNKELNQILDGDKISSQISDYICSTFLDQDESEQTAPTPADKNNSNSLSKSVEENSVQSTITADKLRRVVPASVLVRVGSSTGGTANATGPTENSQKTVVVLGARPFSV
ncbi:unnamed protein product, partial [Dibothriocephalus latus]